MLDQGLGFKILLFEFSITHPPTLDIAAVARFSVVPTARTRLTSATFQMPRPTRHTSKRNRISGLCSAAVGSSRRRVLLLGCRMLLVRRLIHLAAACSKLDAHHGAIVPKLSRHGEAENRR